MCRQVTEVVGGGGEDVGVGVYLCMCEGGETVHSVYTNKYCKHYKSHWFSVDADCVLVGLYLCLNSPIPAPTHHLPWTCMHLVALAFLPA